MIDLLKLTKPTNIFFQGTLIHLETDEAIAQMKPEDTAADNEPEESASKTSEVAAESGSQAAASESAQNSQTSVVMMVDSEKPKKKEKLIKNQFNYQDRGTQSGKFNCC